MNAFARVAGGLLVGLALLSAGCGGTGTVSGKVYYNDQPLGGGTIQFKNADGKGVQQAKIQPDGSYTIENMPAGPASIAVETESARPTGGGGGRGGAVTGQPGTKNIPTDNMPDGGAGVNQLYGGGRPKDAKYVKIPEQYKDLDKSGQTYTVKKGAQEWDVKLK
jgi:hypothetical protein